MAITGISITKQVVFRDSVQPFSNVYHYQTVGTVDVTLAQALRDQLVTWEKATHGPRVTFTFFRAWSAGGSPAANEMITQGTLSGSGTGPTAPYLDAERAFLAQWPAGFDTRGKRVYLRKWYHLCATFAGATLTDAILSQTGGFGSTDRANMASQYDDLTSFTAGSVTWNLCAESGRLPTEDPVAYKYLEHHQLGDEWRG